PGAQTGPRRPHLCHPDGAPGPEYRHQGVPARLAEPGLPAGGCEKGGWLDLQVAEPHTGVRCRNGIHLRPLLRRCQVLVELSLADADRSVPSCCEAVTAQLPAFDQTVYL